MNILVKEKASFPFEWINLKDYPLSKGNRVTFKIKSEINIIDETIRMFHYIFSGIKEELNVYNEHWGDFCLDVWNIQSDVYEYNKNSLSKETQAYLNMLEKSGIEKDYTGTCKCNNWDLFLPIILRCVVNHIAPYSPLLYSVTGNFFFYFHYLGEIGLYYKECDKTIKEIIHKWNNYLLSGDQYIYY